MTGAETLGMGLLLLALLTMFFASMAPGGLLTRRQWGQVVLASAAVGAVGLLLVGG